jgi:hypothetical protein
MLLISSFRPFLNVVCFLLGNYAASEFRRRIITQRKARTTLNVLFDFLYNCYSEHFYFLRRSERDIIINVHKS